MGWVQVCVYALSLLLVAGAGKNIYFTAIHVLCRLTLDDPAVSCAEICMHARGVIFEYMWGR